jgi:hypothetical protein
MNQKNRLYAGLVVFFTVVILGILLIMSVLTRTHANTLNPKAINTSQDPSWTMAVANGKANDIISQPLRLA